MGKTKAQIQADKGPIHALVNEAALKLKAIDEAPTDADAQVAAAAADDTLSQLQQMLVSTDNARHQQTNC
jgi:hypothetical protein